VVHPLSALAESLAARRLPDDPCCPGVPPGAWGRASGAAVTMAMRQRRASRTRGVLAACAVLLAPGVALGQGFSTAPLSTPAAMPSDSLPVTARAFLDWLRAQDTATFNTRAQEIREHLYALVGGIVRQRFASAHSTDVPQGDTTLAALFTWADRFGVPGAGEVARAISATAPAAVTPNPEDGFHLSFSASAFSLATEHGKWMVRFPYFFMIGAITRQHLANGIDNDVATLSTLTAANSAAVGGASQATILLLSGQTADLPSYVGFWLKQLQISPTDTIATPIPQAMRSYRHFDAASHLWTELVALQIPSGSLVVVYVGLDGTYQTNRPHFLDLLTSLRVHQ
jgi:hypothetical protein